MYDDILGKEEKSTDEQLEIENVISLDPKPTPKSDTVGDGNIPTPTDDEPEPTEPDDEPLKPNAPPDMWDVDDLDEDDFDDDGEDDCGCDGPKEEDPDCEDDCGNCTACFKY